MRKYRSWLMGLGIGLIIGATMLQVILVARDQVNESLTRDQLDVQAEKMGLVILSTKQLGDKVEEAIKEAEKKKASTKEPSKGIDDSKDNSQASIEPKASDVSDSEEAKAVTLYIPVGMNFTDAARKLQQLGVIDDADDFIDKASSISKKLNVGTAVFPGKLTYREIMNELTRSKEN